MDPIWRAKHKPATPDWPRWINRPTLELWEAIALSLDMDPANYNPQGIVEEFDVRIEFALAHLTPGNLLAHVQLAARRHLTQVRLADIARLAHNYKPAWKLPPEFPQDEEQPPAPAAVQPLNVEPVQATPQPNKAEPAPKSASSTNEWGEYDLKRLLDESRDAGSTHQTLADKYGVSRQRIGALLKKAKDAYATKRPSAIRAFANPLSKK